MAGKGSLSRNIITGGCSFTGHKMQDTLAWAEQLTEDFDNVFPFETGDHNWGSPATTNDGSNIYFTSKSGSVFNYSDLGMESWDTEGLSLIHI